jgi:hypothetical protein
LALAEGLLRYLCQHHGTRACARSSSSLLSEEGLVLAALDHSISLTLIACFHCLFLDGLIFLLVIELSYINSLWCSTTHYSDKLGFEVEFGGAYLELSVSCGKSTWCVSEADLGSLVAHDLTNDCADLNVRMRIDILNLIFKSDWAVTFNLHCFLVGEAYFAAGAHVKLAWKQAILTAIYHWIGMDWNQDLVTLAVDPDAIIEILELVVWSKLHIDVLTDARGDHAFLVILDLEERCAWW